ncbi:MAG: BatA domain-containing protein [Planctomycetes bacterium]|nr:BatA domain-containing protein [Planctomycetota bacterium]
MTLLAWPALILLLAAGVLFALATLGSRPRRRDVGTLLIWRRVVAKRAATRQRRRNYDLLLWLSLAAVLVGALGAARPALLRAETSPQVAVYVEATGGAHEQLDMADVRRRAEAAVPDGRFTYFLPGAALGAVDVRTLPGGPVQAELAQFEQASSDFDARIMFLNSPVPHAERLGLVVPRVQEARSGVVFDVRVRGTRVVVKRTAGAELRIEGARFIEVARSAGEDTWVFEAESGSINVPSGAASALHLTHKPFVVGVGDDWNGDAHAALLTAIGAEDAGGDVPAVWLGAREGVPAVRIGRGAPADLSKAELSFDPQHPLFRDVPLRDFDWAASGRAMVLDDDARPLIRAYVDGKPTGDLVRARGDILEFAADPFADAPIASSALLLDNAIGVVTGERPSRMSRYVITDGERLPSRRAALAAPFEAYGAIDASRRGISDPLEFTTWAMLIAGLALVGACVLVVRATGTGPRLP